MIEHATDERQARDYLSTLGLTFLIDSAHFDPDAWGEICRLAGYVLECVTFSEPAEVGGWLRIDSHCSEPDMSGWITGNQPVTLPYWIRKVDLSRLQELEDFLALLRRR